MELKKTLLVALATTLALGSCTDFTNGFDEKAHAYQENFEAVFGKIDANQTWSTATRSTLDVSLNMPSTNDEYKVKVYTANPRDKFRNDCYLLGEWNVKNGSQNNLTFDMPADLKNAWVSVVNSNGARVLKQVAIKNNECKVVFNENTKANFARTRAASDVPVTVTTLDELAVWPLKYYFNNEETGFLDVYKESSATGGGINYDDGLISDYEFVANGDPITAQLFYSATSSSDAIKFFYYFPETEDLATVAADANRQYTLIGDVQKCNYSYASYKVVSDIYYGGVTWGGVGASANYGATSVSYNIIKNSSDLVGKTFKVTETEDITITGDDPAVKGCQVRVEGIPDGAHIVFYCVSGGGNGECAYTRTELNQTVTYITTGKTGKGHYAGLFPKMAGDSYIVGFEDALSGYDPNISNAEYDINDCVIAFSGGLVPEDHEDESDIAMSYIVAYEDLGASYDFDFNDIVLKITHVSGRTTATVTVLAAGGTLPVKLTYDGKTYCEDVHSAFGVSTDVPVNVMPGKHKEHPSKTFTIAFEGEFSLSKFGIAVKQNSESDYNYRISAPQYYGVSLEEEGTLIDNSSDTKDSKLPYAILIANPNWDWCDEKVSISTVEGFSEWVQNATTTNWYDLNHKWGSTVEEEPSEDNEDDTTSYGTDISSYYDDCIPASFFEGATGATITCDAGDWCQLHLRTKDYTKTYYSNYNSSGKITVVLSSEDINEIISTGGLRIETSSYNPQGLWIKLEK